MWTFTTSNTACDKSIQKANASFEVLLGRTDLGFLDLKLVDHSIHRTLEMQSFFKDKESIVVMGLGGSSLGAKAVFESLRPNTWKNKIKFLDNVDGQSLDSFLESVTEPEKWGWILCSKSGGTIEVTTLYDYCYQWIKENHNLSIVENSFVVTEEKESPLFNMAKENNLPIASMPKNIGGRFSIFSPIGLVPLSFLGIDLEGLKKGFSSSLEHKDLIVRLSAQIFDAILRKDQSIYFFQYSDQLSQWSLWLQQLLSESLAKKNTRSGKTSLLFPSVIPCRGVSDQHSVLQQIIEGGEKKIGCFHRVETSEESQMKIEKSLFSNSLLEGKNPGILLGVEARATELAMNESQIPTMVLKTKKLDEESMSFLMGVWMLSTGVLGEMMDINAFDQPGVESGKVIARRVLSQGN